jgi:hypothetical protein
MRLSDLPRARGSGALSYRLKNGGSASDEHAGDRVTIVCMPSRRGFRMIGNRRRGMRQEKNRRGASPVPIFDPVHWRVEGESRDREGVLVGVSARGLALLTERPVTPAPGRRLVPRTGGAHRAWRRAVVVTRVDPLSGLLDLVAAEYIGS